MKSNYVIKHIDGRKVRLNTSGKTYIVRTEYDNKGEMLYYCNIEKNGQAYGATRIFKTHQITFL